MLETEAYTPEPNTDRLQRVQFAGQSTILRVSGMSTARVPQLIGVGTKKYTTDFTHKMIMYLSDKTNML